jgi:hypothetical protein
MPQKQGINYYSIRDRIRNFDLIAFRGSDLVSDLIGCLQSFETYTHVGIALRTDVLANIAYHDLGFANDLEKESVLMPHSVFVWESTASGRIGDGACDVTGATFVGVQLRDLDEVMSHYDRHAQTRIAWCPLQEDWRRRLCCANEQQRIVANLFAQYNHTYYDANCFSLFGALFACCRPCRKVCLRTAPCVQHAQICSELAANIYREIGILPPNIESQNVIPADFFVGDCDEEIPFLFRDVIRISVYTE